MVFAGEKLKSSEDHSERLKLHVFTESIKIYKKIQDANFRFEFGEIIQVSQSSCTPDLLEKTYIAIVECRADEIEKDTGLIEKISRMKPDLPIVGFTESAQENVIEKFYRAGVTDCLNITCSPEILGRKIRFFRGARHTYPRLIERNDSLTEATDFQLKKEIFDNLSSAYFTINPDLSVGGITSKSCQEIFGDYIAGKRVDTALNLKGNDGEKLHCLLDQVFNSEMPVSSTTCMLPEEAETREGKFVQLKFNPLLDSEQQAVKLIVTATDISDSVKERREYRKTQQANQLVMNLLKNIDAFKLFLAQFRMDLHMLSTTSKIQELKRLLHTLKGNFGVLGFRELTGRIGQMESSLDQVSSPPVVRHLLRVYGMEMNAYMRNYLKKNREVLKIDFSRDPDFDYRIPKHFLNEILDLTGNGNSICDDSRNRIRDIIKCVTLTSVSSLTSGYPEIIENIARKCHKKIEFHISGDKLRINAEKFFLVFRNLVHLLINACDHGIEVPEVRKKRGKNPVGTICLSFSRDEQQNLFCVDITDDGEGINADLLKKIAIERGIWSCEVAAKKSGTDCNDLLFRDDISTGKSRSGFSGRGVGMAALHQSVLQAGGHIEIHSIGPGLGTRVAMKFKEAS